MEATIAASGLTMPSVAPVGAPEEPLIRETEWGAIRELHARGMSKRAIARQLELDIKTVRKWLKKEWRRRRREATERRRADTASLIPASTLPRTHAREFTAPSPRLSPSSRCV